jgi:SOS response regulatory protein OraA/RecX
MELLSTTHFVQNAAMVENTKSRTIREVRRVKGDKFSEEEIEEAIKYLKEHGF